MTLLRTTPTEITALAEALAGIHPEATVLLETTGSGIRIEVDGVEVARPIASDVQPGEEHPNDLNRKTA